MSAYRGRAPEFGWSLHMSGGWRGQLDRVRRWHARATAAVDLVDKQDYLYAFFESACHLRDWLKDTGTVSGADLDTLFQNNEDMRLCRDLANAHKHHSITRPSQPSPPSEAREYVPSNQWHSASSTLVVLSDGKKHDLLDLGTRILLAWERFIASHVFQ